MPDCYAKGCNSKRKRSRKNKKQLEWEKENGIISFHRIPMEPEERRKLLNLAVFDASYVPGTAFLCSLHFDKIYLQEVSHGVTQIRPNTVPSGKVENYPFPPFQDLHDFLYGSYELPAFHEWKNRVHKNFYYYETNYLALLPILYLSFLPCNPKELFFGPLTIAFAYFTAIAVEWSRGGAPLLALPGMLVVYWNIYSVLLFLAFIELYLLLICAHSSLRPNNSINERELNNKMECKRIPVFRFIKTFVYPVMSLLSFMAATIGTRFIPK